MTAFLIPSPPANTLSYDVMMHAVHFWGQGKSNLSDQRVSLPVTEREGKVEGNMLHLPFVYGQKEICLAHPYFIQGPMLIFPSPFPSLSVTGRTLSDQTKTFSLVPKNELHAS